MAVAVAQYKGASAIVEKLSSLPRVQHKTSTMDIQPGANSSLVIFVTGILCIDGNEQQPLNFCEVFTLFQVGPFASPPRLRMMCNWQVI